MVSAVSSPFRRGRPLYFACINHEDAAPSDDHVTEHGDRPLRARHAILATRGRRRLDGVFGR